MRAVQRDRDEDEAMTGPVRKCVTCHGDGVKQKIENGKVTTEMCPACKGKGHTDTRTL
jgi:DnaJ-class molecular chaperone